MSLPSHGRMAVFDRPNAPFRLVDYPLQATAARWKVLVRIRMSTICRSDIHSYQGHRPSPCPGLLGHEIIGIIEAISGSPGHLRHERYRAGADRVTWSEYFTPARTTLAKCSICRRNRSGLKNTATFQPSRRHAVLKR